MGVTEDREQQKDNLTPSEKTEKIYRGKGVLKGC